MLRLCLAALLLLARPASAEERPRDVVDATVAAVLEILREKDSSVDSRRERIEDIVYDRFDFETMGKLVLARNWKKFDPEQRKTFIEEFKRHLSRSYSDRIERYEQEQVEIVGERPERHGDVTVLTVIRGGRFDGAEVNYRMRRSEAGWRVIDVIIEGVSLVSNFRSQFKDIVAKSGPQGLIDQLRQKNEMPEAA